MIQSIPLQQGLRREWQNSLLPTRQWTAGIPLKQGLRQFLRIVNVDVFAKTAGIPLQQGLRRIRIAVIMYIVNDSKHSITTRIRHELSSRALPHDMFVEACHLDGYDNTKWCRLGKPNGTIFLIYCILYFTA